ncbi:hypothetical protein FRC08_018000, partial [Ceratobasidium sp. 394]
MILDKLDVWITTGAHQRLTEYARVRSSKDTVECWIPSAEGETFAINWDLVKHLKRAKFGLQCSASLDGVNLPYAVILTPPDISAGESGFWDNVCIKGRKREFLFGKLQVTDQEELAPLDDTTVKDLNTIKVKISWVHGCKKVYCSDSSESSESSDSEVHPNGTGNDSGNAPPARWVNEQLAQKGHGGSAELGPPLPKSPRTRSPAQENKKKKKKKKKGQSYHYDYQVAETPSPLCFVFHYGPKDWLQDKGIIRKPAPTPAIDLSNGQPQPQPTQDEDVSASRGHTLPPTSHDGPGQGPTAPAAKNATHSNPSQPRTVPPASTTEGERALSLPHDTHLADGAFSSDKYYTVDRDEKVHLTALALPSANLSKSQQPTGSRTLSVKREREPTPSCTIDAEVISSDDEIILLDIKPPKQT